MLKEKIELIDTVEKWLGEDNKLGIDIWTRKYRHGDETFLEWLDRVSGGDPNLRDLILDKKFLFGGRILANRGLNKKVTYSNCYVIDPPEDSIESIFETASKLARTFSYGGGCGIDISKLAPRGAKVNNSAKETTGAVSFMELYNLVTGLIGQNGRRGALMLSIDSSHPDLEEFISVKNDLQSITNANISVKVDDEFMKAVIEDKEYTLSFTREATGETISKTVRAKDIFEKLCENNWDFAEPGLLFWDTIKNNNLLSNEPYFEYAGVNPCAEEPLPAGGSCLLGSLNLAEFVYNGRFNFLEFKTAVSIAVRALNDVLDEGLPLHPLAEQRYSVGNWRQIGLGIFGLADMLIKLGLEYGSNDAISLCDEIGMTMIDHALCASSCLAKKDGPYPGFNMNNILNNDFFKRNTSDLTKNIVKKYGLRNSQLLTIAPTGSLSTMLGVSGGIEPIYDISYTRKTESLYGEDKYYKVFTPIVDKFMKEKGIEDEKYLPSYFVTAKTISPVRRVEMQATWQQYIDASISSTINLPEETTVDQVVYLYEYAWGRGLKGLTIFRDKCARLGILSSDEPKEEIKTTVEDEYTKSAVTQNSDGISLMIDNTSGINWSEITVNPDNMSRFNISPKPSIKNYILDSITPLTREELGDRLNGSTYVKHTACGKLYITINRDENDNLVEVFIDPGKSGGCIANAEALGRYASACMRAGISIESIIDINRGVKCAACAKTNKKVDGLSCSDIVARVIQEEYDRYHKKDRNDAIDILRYTPTLKEVKPELFSENKSEVACTDFKNACPECGVELASEGGCVTCKNCGYSKCEL